MKNTFSKQDLKHARNEVSSWNFSKLSNGLIHLSREYVAKKKVKTNDFNGPYWMLSKINFGKGCAEYIQDNQIKGIHKSTAFLWMPPYSAIELNYINTVVRSETIIGLDKSPKIYPKNPILFFIDKEELPMSLKEIEKFLKTMKGINISRCLNPNSHSIDCKMAIDYSFLKKVSISSIAHSIATSHPQMTRNFKKDFGVTPVMYRNWIRVVTACFLLLEERKASDVCFEVGFEDLSRFNKQFKKIAQTSPKSFKAKKSKNA